MMLAIIATDKPTIIPKMDLVVPELIAIADKNGKEHIIKNFSNFVRLVFKKAIPINGSTQNSIAVWCTLSTIGAKNFSYFNFSPKIELA